MKTKTRAMTIVLAAWCAACAGGTVIGPASDGGEGDVVAGEGEGEGEGDDVGNEGEGDDVTDPSEPCEVETVTAPTGPSCAASTKTCIDACGDDDACYDNCINADAGADACSECLDSAYMACVNAAGCQQASDTLSTCACACPDPEADSCYDLTCGPENSALDRCIEDNGAGCADADQICFGT
jgi:hypothetical protein